MKNDIIDTGLELGVILGLFTAIFTNSSFKVIMALLIVYVGICVKRYLTLE